MLTDTQLNQRRNGIGGSDAAAVIGVSRFKSPLDVYRQKLGLIEDMTPNDSMYFGNLLEPIVANEYEKRTGKQCEIENETKKHSKHGWMLANIDRVIKGENAILECKTTASSEGWGEPGTDEIPTDYLFQCAHYAAVCEVERVDIAVLIKGSDFRIYTYRRNESLEKKLIHKEEEFWEKHIISQCPPIPITFKEALLNWNKEVIGKSSIADDEIEDACFSLRRIQSEIKELNIECQKLKLKISNYMKEAETLHDSSGKILATWKIISRKAYSVASSSSRILRLKGE